MKKVNYIYEADDDRLKDFLLSFINKLIIIALSFIVYFSIFYPISLNAYKSDRQNITETKEVILDIGLDSKLMHSDENKKQVYSLTSSYGYYVRTLLRYDYENSGYDLEADPDNYSLKKEEIDLFPEINGYNDDFFGFFYTEYALDKDLYELETYTKEDYFRYQILKIDDESSGQQFFKNEGNDYPHLKDEVRIALYNYVVIGATSSKYSKIDKAFFNYFSTLFEEAGNLLLTYEPYKSAYDSYNVSYQKVYDFSVLSIYLSFILSLISVVIIVPIFNHNKQNVSQLILRRVDLDNEGKIKPRIYIVRFIYDLFRNFPSIIVPAIVLNIELVFTSIFSIGSFPINLFGIALVLSLMNIVSLMFGLIRKDHKNLLAMINNTDNYYVKRY